MKTSSAYPVLDNRPIDQWKVTELKEELKRRKLTTRGLKEELVRRLDESLRSEMEAEKEEADNGVDEPESDNIAEAVVTEQTDDETVELGLGTPETAKENVGDESDDGDRVINVGDAGDRMTGVDDESVQVDSAVSVELPADGKGQEQDVLVQADSRDSIEQPVDGKGLEEQDVSVQFNSKDSIEQPVDSKGQEEQDVSLQADSKDSFEQPVEDKVQEEEELGLVSDQSLEVGTFTANDMSSAGLGNEISEGFSSENAADDKGMPDGIMGRDDEGSRAPEPAEDLKPLHEDGKLDSSDSNNQVSEVSSSLGFPIKSNSISTDSVSINEKNDLKDNIIADNVKLESDVKPEMVQPSSELVPDGGKSHPCDVEEPYENKVSVQETDNNVTNADLSQKNYSADLGSSEKLNLDRSSGDDSMEEDALESKHIDSNYNSEEVVEKTEKNEVTAIKEERPVATMDIDKPEKEKDTNHEYNIVDAASTDKRKLSDQEAVLNNEPSKRQRRWKSESNHVKEPQILDIPPPQVVVKDVPQPAVLKRNLSASDSSGGANEPPKEREVPPSSKPATDSLRIDRFLRPFTLKAVQELLAKTGTVTSFWMDHIKTHCYVTYSSVEEAVETRNAVFNLQWPPNGGRHLVAEFVDPEEVKARLEKPPPSPATPVSSGPAVSEPAPTMPQPSPRQQTLRQQMSQQPTLPPPPPLSNPPQAREYALPPPPPPPLNEKVEAPILTLDDLFKKTKATPRIYYLPLSEEQVAGVLEARSKSSKQ